LLHNRERSENIDQDSYSPVFPVIGTPVVFADGRINIASVEPKPGVCYAKTLRFLNALRSYD